MRSFLTARGSLWIASDDGVHRLSFPEQLKVGKIAQLNQTAEVFTHRGLTSEAAIPILEDREGNLWVGADNGLDRFRASNLVPITLFPGRLPTLVGRSQEVFGQYVLRLDGTRCP